MGYRTEKLDEKYDKALKEVGISKEELNIERMKFDENEILQKKEFDDVVCEMKKGNECLKKNEEALKETLDAFFVLWKKRLQ